MSEEQLALVPNGEFKLLLLLLSVPIPHKVFNPYYLCGDTYNLGTLMAPNLPSKAKL